MRELTRAELKLISGGVETLVVYANPVYEFPEISYGYDYDGVPVYDGGEGTYQVPAELTQAEVNSLVESRSDMWATVLASMINNHPDHNIREIGYILYKDKYGNVDYKGPFLGDIGADTIRYTNLHLSADDIVGIVHSHPTGVIQPGTYELNKYASYNGPGADSDWNTADIIRNAAHDQSGFETRFSHYIVGPDNVLREYDFNDRDVTSLGATPTYP